VHDPVAIDVLERMTDTGGDPHGVLNGESFLFTEQRAQGQPLDSLHGHINSAGSAAARTLTTPDHIDHHRIDSPVARSGVACIFHRADLRTRLKARQRSVGS
jgi:hypothetical protein